MLNSTNGLFNTFIMISSLFIPVLVKYPDDNIIYFLMSTILIGGKKKKMFNKNKMIQIGCKLTAYSNEHKAKATVNPNHFTLPYLIF